MIPKDVISTEMVSGTKNRKECGCCEAFLIRLKLKNLDLCEPLQLYTLHNMGAGSGTKIKLSRTFLTFFYMTGQTGHWFRSGVFKLGSGDPQGAPRGSMEKFIKKRIEIQCKK